MCPGNRVNTTYAQAGEVAARHHKSDWQAVAALRSAYEWLVPFRSNPVVQQRLEAALEALGPQGGDRYLQLQAQLAKILPSDVDRAEQRRRAALAHAALGKLSQITNPLVASVVLDGCRSALHDTESPATLLPLSQQLKRLVTRVGFERFPGEAHMALIIDLVRLGRMHQARRELEEHREHAKHTRRPLVAYSQLVADAMFALWDGRFDAAQHHIMGLFSEVPGSAQPLPLGAEGVTQQIATAQFGWLLRERGQADQLIQQEDAVQEMIRQTGHTPMWRAALALLYAETGNPKRAADIIAAIARESDDFAAFPPHGWAVPTLYLTAEVCDTVTSAEVLAAERLIASQLPRRLRGLLKPHLDDVALAGWPTVLVGPVARAAGLAALVCRDYNAALSLFKRAEQHTGGSKPTQARLHVDMARALLGRGDRTDLNQAADRLHLAVRAAEELGMSRLAARAQVLLAAP